jgi:hypothetical protein
LHAADLRSNAVIVVIVVIVVVIVVTAIVVILVTAILTAMLCRGGRWHLVEAGVLRLTEAGVWLRRANY